MGVAAVLANSDDKGGGWSAAVGRLRVETPSPFNGDTYVAVGKCRCGSWACAPCATHMGHALAKRLRRRFAHQTVAMITLTFDREQFPTCLSAWEFVKRNRSVGRAMAHWFAAKGVTLPYFWRMQLQPNSGFIHYHVLVPLPGGLRLDRDDFQESWRYGFSRVDCDVDATGYLAGYVADGKCPIEAVKLSGLPAVGIRWSGCSKGFWGCDSEEAQPETDRGESWEDMADHCPDTSFDIGAIEEAAARRAEMDAAREANKQETLYARVQACGAVTEVSVGDGKAATRFRFNVMLNEVLVNLAFVSVGAVDDQGAKRWITDVAGVIDVIASLPIPRKDVERVLESFSDWAIRRVSELRG